MSVIQLKIGFPPGGTTKYKVMKLKLSLSVKETIVEICKANKISDPNQHVLLLPPPSPELNSIWMEAERLLSSYPLQAKDIVELRRKFQVIRIRFRGVYQRVLIDINEPFSKVMPSIAKKYQLDNIAEYKLYLRKTELETDKSLREQLISADATYILKKEGEEEMEIEEEEVEKAEDDKEDETEEPLDIQNATPKSIKNPQKAGFLHMKQSRKKKCEPKWTILKAKFLFFFKTQSDKKPIAVAQVDQFKMKLYEADDKEKKSKEDLQFTFELTNDTETFILKCDNENHLKSWMSAVQRVLDNSDGTDSGGSGGGVFGAPLRTVVGPGQLIPEIVEQCIKYLNAKALTLEGIFRLSGSATVIENYRKAFDNGDKVDLWSEPDPHAIAGLLKLYFRSLPEPILTYDLYDAIIAAQSAPNQGLRIRYLKGLIQRLPQMNLELTKQLFQLLTKVNEQSKVNKMGLANLATVFGPNLLISPDRSMLQMVQDTPLINGIVSNLIQFYDNIFLGKEIAVTTAVVLFDYAAQEESEISLTQGEVVKVLHQGEDGWWQGEANGKMGRFPGTYVKVEIKSKKEQFKEDMMNAKKTLDGESKAVAQLEESKKILEKEIGELKAERTAFDEEIKELRSLLLGIIKTEKLDKFLPSLQKYHAKIVELKENEDHLQQTRNAFTEDLTALKRFFKNPPADAKKTLKGKSQEKVESGIGMLQMKMNAESKKRVVVSERLEDLHRDLSSLHELLVKT